MLSIDVRAEQKRRLEDGIRAAKAFLNVIAGRREGSLVGHDHSGLVAKSVSKHSRGIVAYATADH